MCYVLLEGDMSYVTYATCDLAILQKPGLTSRIPLQCNHTEVTSKNGLLHMTMKYISRCKKIREGRVTKEKRREGTGIRSVYGATSFQAKCIQSAQAQNFPNPFPAVVHGVLQELADVGTAGNAVHGRRT
ncbi:hypothetical protein ALC57_08596 [Trachymyrmex cornetzi]|uniref:Uncharacterized protein n=1 Tax=Trachymyrmex cornetzi TaxID=471704 RepID=A0A151J6U8_9HYME|nr:hypothetical protein ALC57_08596 [Trachymyrmex cornetzi]